MTLANDKDNQSIQLYGVRDYTSITHYANDDLTHSYMYCLKHTGTESACLYVSAYSTNGLRKIKTAAIERFDAPAGKIDCMGQK